jgi:predicted O-methyltransferase YrrM
MTLPKVKQSQIDVRPIDWGDMPRRFLNPGELEVLVALVRSVQPRGVLEFGVNVGRTAKAILANVPGIERYQGVDVPVGYVPAMAAQRDEVPAEPGMLVKGDSRFELLVRPRGSHDLRVSDLRPCDAVFIDGDHSRAGVLNDTELARYWVRPGGIIIFHDYHDLRDAAGVPLVDVRAVLHDFAAAGHDIKHVEGTWLAFEAIP